jgi:hypothetical protein
MLELNLKKSEKSRSMNTKKICKRALLKVYITSFILLTLTINITAQVGIGTNNPDNSAALHIEDTARGILIPRMTLTQRQAIQSPAEGLMVYQTTNPAGFWYFSNNQWNNLAGAANGGKQTLILSDNITNAEAQAKILAEVGANTQEIRIVRCTNLTTVDLSMLTGVTQIYIVDNPVLQQVNFSAIKNIDESLTLKNCPQLNTINFNTLEKIGQSYSGLYGLEISNTGLSSLNLLQLKQVYGRVYITQNPSLTSVSMPALTSLPSTDFLATRIQDNTSLTSINLSSLTQCGYLNIYGSSVTSLNLNALANCTASILLQFEAMNAISLPSLTTVSNSIYITNGLALNTINLPSLSTLGSELQLQNNNILNTLTLPAFTNGHLTILNCLQLSSINTPLFSTGSLELRNLANLTSINCPVLSNATISIQDNPAINSISFPALTTSSDFIISNCNNLTAVSLNTYNSFTGSNFDFSGNRLPSFQINTLLNKLVNAVPQITSKLIYLRQDIPAPPTGQGITDKSTLISWGNQVSTD